MFARPQWQSVTPDPGLRENGPLALYVVPETTQSAKRRPQCKPERKPKPLPTFPARGCRPRIGELAFVQLADMVRVVVDKVQVANEWAVRKPTDMERLGIRYRSGA